MNGSAERPQQQLHLQHHHHGLGAGGAGGAGATSSTTTTTTPAPATATATHADALASLAAAHGSDPIQLNGAMEVAAAAAAAAAAMAAAAASASGSGSAPAPAAVPSVPSGGGGATGPSSSGAPSTATPTMTATVSGLTAPASFQDQPSNAAAGMGNDVSMAFSNSTSDDDDDAGSNPDASTTSMANHATPRRPAKRPRYARRTIRKACDLCHSTKVKCILPNAIVQPAVDLFGNVMTNDGAVHRPSQPCERCTKLGKDCVFTPVSKRKSRVHKPHGDASNQAKLSSSTPGQSQQQATSTATTSPLGPLTNLSWWNGKDAGAIPFTSSTSSSALPASSSTTSAASTSLAPPPPGVSDLDPSLFGAPSTSTNASDEHPHAHRSRAHPAISGSITGSSDWDVLGSFLTTNPLVSFTSFSTSADPVTAFTKPGFQAGELIGNGLRGRAISTDEVASFLASFSAAPWSSEIYNLALDGCVQRQGTGPSALAPTVGGTGQDASSGAEAATQPSSLDQGTSLSTGGGSVPASATAHPASHRGASRIDSSTSTSSTTAMEAVMIETISRIQAMLERDRRVGGGATKEGDGPVSTENGNGGHGETRDADRRDRKPGPGTQAGPHDAGGASEAETKRSRDASLEAGLRTIALAIRLVERATTWADDDHAAIGREDGDGDGDGDGDEGSGHVHPQHQHSDRGGGVNGQVARPPTSTTTAMATATTAPECTPAFAMLLFALCAQILEALSVLSPSGTSRTTSEGPGTTTATATASSTTPTSAPPPSSSTLHALPELTIYAPAPHTLAHIRALLARDLARQMVRWLGRLVRRARVMHRSNLSGAPAPSSHQGGPEGGGEADECTVRSMASRLRDSCAELAGLGGAASALAPA